LIAYLQNLERKINSQQSFIKYRYLWLGKQYELPFEAQLLSKKLKLWEGKSPILNQRETGITKYFHYELTNAPPKSGFG
jgi:hypothetical protein